MIMDSRYFYRNLTKPSNKTTSFIVKPCLYAMEGIIATGI